MTRSSSLLLLCSLAHACADSAAPSADSALQTDAGASAPAADEADRYDCVISQERFGRDAQTSDSWRVTWDTQTRVKSQHESEREDSPVRLAWRYDMEGRLIAYAGFGAGMYDNFQQDMKYDERGNLTDFRSSYPERPDLNAPSSAAVWIGTSYANEYNAAGELSASTATPYGPGNNGDVTPSSHAFSHDAQGRCQRIEITGGRGQLDSTETRSYDAEGHVASSESLYSRPIGFNLSCADLITTNQYDALGRLTRSTRLCRGATMPAWVESHSYATDASETIETFDYQNDVVNDTMTIDGVEVRFSHAKESHSAGCAQIEAEIAAHADQACHTR